MAPNHDKIRAREDIEAQDYWEAGITAEAISTLKQYGSFSKDLLPLQSEGSNQSKLSGSKEFVRKTMDQDTGITGKEDYSMKGIRKRKRPGKIHP